MGVLFALVAVCVTGVLLLCAGAIYAGRKEE